MIRKSFLFLEKVGPQKEQNLYQQGIKDWQDFLKAGKIKGISTSVKPYYDRQIREAQKYLLENDPAWFIGKLPQKEMWRLYGHFREESCFLDVEIDSRGKVVVVGISNYFQTSQFVAGINLGKESLDRELKKYKIIVTFNGAAFDLPKLEKQMGVKAVLPHIDLKPLCVNMGWKGGLKEIEKRLNLKRPPHLYGNPVELWKAFQASGDREYLELLLEYNREDIENLRGVMENVYCSLAQKYINLAPIPNLCKK